MNGSGGVNGSGGSGGSSAPNLVFSEYVEGTSFNKAVELRNLGSSDADLSTCQVLVYNNGSTKALSTISLTGTVAPNDVFVACGSAFSSACDVVTAALNHNGNDALELRCDGTTLDVIGQIGFDPGVAGWGTAPTVTTNATLRRHCSVEAGDTNGGDAFDPAAEWDGFPVDTLEDLGKNSCRKVFFSEYVEGSGLNKAVEIYDEGTNTASLASCRVEVYANGSSTAGNIVQIPLSATVAAGGTYVVCQQALSSACDLIDTHLLQNGNDALALVCGTEVMDVIGQIGFDPGLAWGTNPSTLNMTLERKCSVTVGDTNGSDVFDPAVEWDGFPQDTFSGLGAHCP